MKNSIYFTFLLVAGILATTSCRRTEVFGVDNISVIFQLDSIPETGEHLLGYEVVHFPLDSVARSVGLDPEDLKELSFEYLHLQALDGSNFNNFQSASAGVSSEGHPITPIGSSGIIPEWTDYVVIDVNRSLNLVEYLRSANNTFRLHLYGHILQPRFTPLTIKAKMRFRVVMRGRW
ncbi:MAG: hypothetical protein N2110_04295 [Flavobacteriales bacterium]|nr:hypothetical protein [Flavobacteriales bacterium]MCX7768230.1 hypothetical protein [Flavobacteriales bacterium]MDW8410133.1 hypothetical protein [Flavobacteriales bacterium]